MRTFATFLSLISGLSIVCAEPWTPPVNESLASQQALPSVFQFANGDPVRTAEDWQDRREEMKAMLLYYQYGSMPDRPDSVTATLIKEIDRDDGRGTEHWLTLHIDSKHRLAMRVVLYLPSKPGPYPVIIREEGTLGRTRQVPMFLDEGYAFVEYARHDLDPDKKGVVGKAQAAYPEHDWATLAVWAWGGMRVVDYLETRDDIDLKRIGITGHSRGGKMALLAGALDERISLVVPNGSGAGGAGSSRILGPGAESIGMNDKPHWYHERIQWFAGREDRLPFDQHFLKALVAPRSLLCTESTDDLFANPYGTQVTSKAALAAYTFVNANPQRNGLRFRTGGHDSNDDDWRALLTFAEWHWFDRLPKNPESFWQLPDSGYEPSDGDDSALDYVVVGDPGNEADVDYPRVGRFGAVKETFQIANRKVTHAEYVTFLNANATRDPHGLHHPRMKIRREGETGAFHYTVDTAFAKQPITRVSWSDALRYCNWLHGGNTETGAYTMAEGQVTRQPGANFFLPTIDEWCKAAYYDSHTKTYRLLPLPDKQTDNGYWQHFNRSHYGMKQTEDTVWEWTESNVGLSFRGIRSDSWFQGNNR